MSADPNDVPLWFTTLCKPYECGPDGKWDPEALMGHVVKYCTKHGPDQGPIDVWYDCDACECESNAWAKNHGYTQCISPQWSGMGHRGSDDGAWVKANAGRWESITLYDLFELHWNPGPTCKIRQRFRLKRRDE